MEHIWQDYHKSEHDNKNVHELLGDELIRTCAPEGYPSSCYNNEENTSVDDNENTQYNDVPSEPYLPDLSNEKAMLDARRIFIQITPNLSNIIQSTSATYNM